MLQSWHPFVWHHKDRMDKKRKAEKVKAGKDGGNKSPKKKGKANEKEKTPCRAFNFGKGNCRYGDKCKFSHEKKKENYKAGEFSPQQEKIMSAMVASAVKKTAALISKKNKKKGEKKVAIAIPQGSTDERQTCLPYIQDLLSCAEHHSPNR